MKNYLLTDFNTERWVGIDIKSIEAEVEALNEKINKIGILYGELGNPEVFEISLKNVSHSIKNLTLVDNKIYGDVEFLDNENGRNAHNLISNLNCRFGIRSTGTYSESEIIINKIFTWDIITNN